MKLPMRILTVAALLLGASLSVSAATVVFENGDRLTGDVLKCEDGVLHLLPSQDASLQTAPPPAHSPHSGLDRTRDPQRA